MAYTATFFKTIDKFNESLFTRGILEEKDKEGYYNSLREALIDMNICMLFEWDFRQKRRYKDFENSPLSEAIGEKVLYVRYDWGNWRARLSIKDGWDNWVAGCPIRDKWDDWGAMPSLFGRDLGRLNEFIFEGLDIKESDKNTYFITLMMWLIDEVTNHICKWLAVPSLPDDKYKALQVSIDELQSNASLVWDGDEDDDDDDEEEEDDDDGDEEAVEEEKEQDYTIKSY